MPTGFDVGGLTFAITGSEKRCDEGAPLFTVRVDGVVMWVTAWQHQCDTPGLPFL